MFRDVALAEKGGFFRVQANGEVVGGEVVCELAQLVVVADCGECVIIRDENKRFGPGLIRDMALHGSEKIAEMRCAAGLNAGKDAHEKNFR